MQIELLISSADTVSNIILILSTFAEIEFSIYLINDNILVDFSIYSII